MHNIRKVAKLDCSLITPYGKVIGFAILFPVLFSAINRSLLAGISFAMCFIAMTTSYVFFISEKNHMERLYGLLPVKKSELVIGRYVFIFAQGGIALIFSLVAHPLALWALGETIQPCDLLGAACCGLFLFAIYIALQIPGYYKFGSIKGRIITFVPIIGYLASYLLITKFPHAEAALAACSGASPLLLVALVTGIVLAISVLSIHLSIRIVKNKEI